MTVVGCDTDGCVTNYEIHVPFKKNKNKKTPNNVLHVRCDVDIYKKVKHTIHNSETESVFSVVVTVVSPFLLLVCHPLL